MHEITSAGAAPLVDEHLANGACAARHQSAGSCSAHAGPGDANGTCALVADATMAPVSFTSNGAGAARADVDAEDWNGELLEA